MIRKIYIVFAFIIIIVSACTNKKSSDELINSKASLPVSFDFDKMGLKVITSFINKKEATMSTLYGNELALKTAIEQQKNHHAGEVLALVTWKQQDDPIWFGARIPAALQSVELIKTREYKSVNGSGEAKNMQHPTVNYQKFEGKDLVLNPDTLHQYQRIKFIFGQQPSIMP